MRWALTYTPTDIAFGPIVLRNEPLSTACAVAAEYGFEGLEVHLRRPNDIDWDALAELRRARNLGVSTIGTGMAGVMDGLTFSDPDPPVRARTVQLVCRHIEHAAAAGAAVTIGFLNGCLGREPGPRAHGRQAVIECYRDSARAAEAAGVTLLLEALNRYECDYLNTVADGLAMIDEIGSPAVKLLCDTFHMNIEETDICAALRQAGPRLGYVHLADSNRRAPGMGHLPVADVLDTLVAVGYQGWIGLEVLPLPDWRSACAAVAPVRRLLES